jgi:hypothetical protein
VSRALQRYSAEALERPSAESPLSTILTDYFHDDLEHARLVGNVGFYARVLTQATLPHRDPKTAIFERKNGALSLSMAAPPSEL